MIYTVDMDGQKQTFEGFCAASFPIGPDAHKSLATVFDMDRTMLGIWYLDTDCPIALDELKRYYRMDGEVVKIQIWKGAEEVVGQEVS